jgi:hypothetical protein
MDLGRFTVHIISLKREKGAGMKTQDGNGEQRITAV